MYPSGAATLTSVFVGFAQSLVFLVVVLVGFAQSLVFCVVFYGSLFVFLLMTIVLSVFFRFTDSISWR